MINQHEYKKRIDNKFNIGTSLSVKKERERLDFLKFANSKTLNNNKHLVNEWRERSSVTYETIKSNSDKNGIKFKPINVWEE